MKLKGKFCGILTNYLYTIVGTVELMSRKGHKIRLLRVFSPWKGKKWKGSFSKGSKELKDEFLLKKIDHFNQENL